MKKYLLSFWAILLLVNASLSQDVGRVRSYLDTLCAPGMHGRGYINHGEKIAAEYIEDQFKKIGLGDFASDPSQSHPYFQNFHLDINTFPGKISLKADKTSLVPGTDFIMSPASGKGKGRLPFQLLDTLIFSNTQAQQTFLKLKVSKKALAYPAKFSSQFKKLPNEVKQHFYSAGCLIKIQDKKLTASLAEVEMNQPEFEVKSESLPLKTKKINFEVDAKLLRDYPTQNVLGFVKGSEYPDSFIVISAHYDHLGRMGQIYFPGANDNASGVSLLLELARYYKENVPPYSIAFMAFGAEEAGLIGSEFYTRHPLFPLKKIRFLINLDLLGTGEEGIMVVNGATYPTEFKMIDSLNNNKKLLPAVKKRGPAANSDHYYFSQKGVPSFFIYTLGGISAYHDICDRKETLPLTRFTQVFELLTNFIQNL